MRTLIRSIAESGKSVVVSSHQLSEMELVCDDVTIINRGKLVISGTLDEVRVHAGGDRVVVTVQASERDRSIAMLQANNVPARPLLPATDLVVEISADATAHVTRVLAHDGIFLSGLRTERSTLETAFLNLTGGPPPPTGPPTGPPVAPPTVASEQQPPPPTPGSAPQIPGVAQ